MSTELKHIILILFIFVCIGLGVYCYSNYKTARIEFYKQYASELVAIAEIHSADYYGLDWLLCMAVTQAESDFKTKARSTYRKNGFKYHCYGLKQLSLSTSAYTGKALKRKFPEMDFESIYGIERNVYGGNLFLRDMLDNYCAGNWIMAVELYNVGYGAYRRGRIEGVNRNSRHVKKVSVYYTQLKKEWSKFNKYW